MVPAREIFSHTRPIAFVNLGKAERGMEKRYIFFGNVCRVGIDCTDSHYLGLFIEFWQEQGRYSCNMRAM